MKNLNQPFGKDCFEDQLKRLSEVRSHEKTFYQKITDIYSQYSADYNVDSETTKDFLQLFKISCIVQLKVKLYVIEIFSLIDNSKKENIN